MIVSIGTLELRDRLELSTLLLLSCFVNIACADLLPPCACVFSSNMLPLLNTAAVSKFQVDDYESYSHRFSTRFDTNNNRRDTVQAS